MVYTNGSSITKTFHGVTFQPGDTKDVSGIINDPTFVKSSTRKEPPKRSRRSQKAAKVEETNLEEATLAEDSTDVDSLDENKEV